jgi:altronate hydrolase
MRVRVMPVSSGIFRPADSGRTEYALSSRLIAGVQTAMPAPLTIRLHPNDNVVVARMDILPTTTVEGDVAALTRVPPGHKILTRAVKKGEPLRKYNQIIGFATDDLPPGTHIHTHNCVMGDFERDYAFCADAHPTAYVNPPATFMGYRRADRRSATRNYIGIVTTVNCSAATSRMIAKHVEPLLAQFPNIDGVVPLTHGGGCGMAASGLEMDVLRRTLAGYTRHPNMAAVVMLGLGCETNQISGLMDAEGLTEGPKLIPMAIQDEGGVSKTVMRAVGFLKELLPEANAVKREPIPVSELILALQCGGSDGYSGISANPALGAAVDLLVRHGGSAVLSETPEIYGAEHLLTRRAVSREVGEKIVKRIKWWEDHCARTGGEMNNNPSPGNKAGGLTTILEKSLGAVAKGGTTNLVDVYEYAQPITAKGFVYMDSPGYDPVSATGQVAGGANVLCFTTGRGSVFGCKPTPSLKLATNSALYRRMTDDMDINCGAIVDGEETIQESGKKIFELIVNTASGQKTKSEALGIGDDEFEPWKIGATM